MKPEGAALTRIARHRVLAAGDSFAVCSRQVRRFFDLTSLVVYDCLEIREELSPEEHLKDAFGIVEEDGLLLVADGMGGHTGGALAAQQVAPGQAAQAPAAAAEFPTGTVENIVVTSSAEASPAVTRLLQMATEQAERLVGESQVEATNIVGAARAEAESVIDGANKKAHETLTDARTRADRIESEARVNAERLAGEAQANADAVNGDADRRRAELFSQLEQERDTLRGRVDHLRSFEANFRSNFTAHLENQVKALREAVVEPGDAPDLLNEPAVESATPRLDALLNEGN